MQYLAWALEEIEKSGQHGCPPHSPGPEGAARQRRCDSVRAVRIRFAGRALHTQRFTPAAVS